MRPLKVGASAVSIFAAVLTAEALLARSRIETLGSPSVVPAAQFGNADSPPIHLVFIGDSTAVGVGTQTVEQSYPWLVAQHLSSRFRVTLDVVGRSGARMKDVESQFAYDAASLKPDVVMIGIGGNDVTHLTPLGSVGRSLEHSVRTLSRTDATVLVALGPRFDSPELKRPLIDLIRFRVRSLNKTLRLTAKALNVEVIDLPAALGDHFEREPDRYFSSDNYHPGPEGYILWANAVEEAIMRAALRRTNSRS
jgi:lysophospholipase L1-like esterase